MLAWGVEGYVVSFIAPHSLTARALVVAPGDLLTINNRSREEPVEVHVDGRPTCELPPGRGPARRVRRARYGTLAQLPGATFYHRLRERFGRLALAVTEVPQLRAEFRAMPPAPSGPLVHPAACSTSCASRTSC